MAARLASFPEVPEVPEEPEGVEFPFMMKGPSYNKNVNSIHHQFFLRIVCISQRQFGQVECSRIHGVKQFS
jgi:hypothetical protein